MDSALKGCGSENAGVEALRLSKRKAVEHLGSASKELGQIAAQYGRLIDTYQRQINDIDADIEKLTGYRDKGANECSTAAGGIEGAGQLATTRLR